MGHATQHRNLSVPVPIEDWRLLEDHAARTSVPKCELARRQLEPLLQLLRELKSEDSQERLLEG
jgi:hypothetical protein